MEPAGSSSTTDLWSPNALTSLEGHAVPVERIGIDDLDAMTVEWSSYDLANPTGLKATDRHVLRPHQVEGRRSKRDGRGQGLLPRPRQRAIPAVKRLYMTATPRLFKPVAADAAKEADALLASMDDPEYFGEEFHRLGFGEAVEQGLLADYRVLILTVDERAVGESFQALLSTGGITLELPTER